MFTGSLSQQSIKFNLQMALTLRTKLNVGSTSHSKLPSEQVLRRRESKTDILMLQSTD